MSAFAKLGGSLATFGRLLAREVTSPGLSQIEKMQARGATLNERGKAIVQAGTPFDNPTSIERASRRADEYWREGMSPRMQEGIEKSLFERSDEGKLKLGAGASDPYWWMDTAINTGVNMMPGIGVGAASARTTYAATFADRLAFAGSKGATDKVAMRYAQREATKAAQRAAALAGGTTEGVIAGGQSAQQIEQTILENTHIETLDHAIGQCCLRREMESIPHTGEIHAPRPALFRRRVRVFAN
jgi:hypothetical protein